MNPFLTKPQGVSEMLTEGKDYIVYKGDGDFEYKYVNLGHNSPYVQRTGVVEIEPLRTNKGVGGVSKHDNYIPIKRYRDKKTKLLWGIPLGYNSQKKDIDHQLIAIEGKMMFDLSIEEDAIKFAIIKNSPFIEGSPNADGRPVYKIKDKEVEASNDIDKRTLRRKAEDIVESLREEGLFEMARNLGINVEANKSITRLTNELYRVIDLNPRNFLDIYNNPQRVYISLFHKAVSLGIIIENRANGTFMFRAIPLGYSKDAAIKHLVDNNNTATAVKLNIDEIESGTLSSMGFTKQTTGVVDEEKEAMKKELEQLRALKAKQADLETKGSADVESNSELETLKLKAKELGVKGWQFAKDVDALKKKIEEAEA